MELLKGAWGIMIQGVWKSPIFVGGYRVNRTKQRKRGKTAA